MPITYANRARMTVLSTGVGTISLGSAIAGYASFAEAGIGNGDEVSYTLEDGTSFEVGRGVYTASGQTLTRNVLLSKIEGQAADVTPISLTGSATIFLTLVAEDIGATIAKPYIDVRDYPVLANGVFDNASAFQDALDAAEASSTHKRVYIPHADLGYALGSAIILPPGVTIFGDNRWGLQLSRIKPVAGYSGPLIESKDFASARQLRMGIEGLYLDGSSTTLTAIRLRCQESIIQHCSIKNCFTYAIYIGGIGSGPTQQALNNHITDNYLAGVIGVTEFFDALFLDYSSADNTIERNYIEACKDAGIRSRGYNNKITNNHIYAVSGTGGGAGIGIHTETSADHDISQNYIELCAAEAILMAGGGSDVATLAAAVHGNVCRNIDTGNTSNGVIEISGSDVSAVSISGNIVRRDAATSYATPYFVYFNGITPTRAKVYGNEWQSGLVTTAEANLLLPLEDFQLSATGAVRRTQQVRIAELGFSVKDFGAVADYNPDTGVGTSDTAAFQAAFDAAEAAGAGTVIIPAGSYLLSTPVTYDASARANVFTAGGRINVIGDGSSVTRIFGKVGSGQAALNFLGPAFGNNAQWSRMVIGGFHLVGQDPLPATGRIGMFIASAIYTKLYDIEISEFNYGFAGRDIVGMVMDFCRFTFNNYGMLFQDDWVDSPVNEVTFIGCHWSGNRQYGLWAKESGNLWFQGGSFEGNGWAGAYASDADRWALRITNPGLNAVNSLKLDGTHFEWTGDVADIWIEHDDFPTTYVLSGCDFFRIGTVDFVTNNIRFDTTGTTAAELVLDGCGFHAVNGYVADAGRRRIAYGSVSGSLHHIRVNGCVGLAPSLTDAPLMLDGTVTQATDKSTSVTLNTLIGRITMHNATLNLNSGVQFALLNSEIASADIVEVTHNSVIGGTAGSYKVVVKSVAAGSCLIELANITAGNLSEAVGVNFHVNKRTQS